MKLISNDIMTPIAITFIEPAGTDCFAVSVQHKPMQVCCNTLCNHPAPMEQAIDTIICNLSNRYAIIFSCNGSHIVHVYDKAPEGHFTCISHAPFSRQPCFTSLTQARQFVDSFGIMPITYR